MAKHVGKKFTWVIKNFSSLQSEKRIYSVPVLIGDCAEASSVEENMIVNGFHVLPSQVCRHPDIAVGFRAKSQHLRTTYMNFLLSLFETLCKSLQELTNEDLVDADISLTYLKYVSFKVDWLEKKLEQVKEKKEKEQSALAKLQELDAQVEEQKAELSVTRTPLSFDDIV
ncbi:unnamed protein product [Arabidopsis lyrata]|uniref:Predicted protein n=1 Tax=Arabidopsis lyrata subsp. lyrata TaxID=81972 RepID=D7KB55_ARALL|nr:MATH domain and coiled-coil domain-containing protein At3g58410 [Arabidopsis lyrata subsp. lyrata]EFH68246.1 predicted protein [Arabidopsis lyrata subsp. lyrata]CAH8256664.1 unnamed protein product [Arabidopsis lyrata]|eukprot:XP_002891987.1 MATH domain and coiled-coil domain-containing protein At3g58410 [Arabidopsis lyrata subsp. lyrata]